MNVPSATHVGRCFIREYYQRLQKSPAALCQLYHENGEYSFAEGDQETQPIAGLEPISKEIERTLGSANARVDLTNGSVDCQNSHDGGVMVIVCGLLTMGDEEPRQFVQSFFLARVPPNSYVIRNSCLRLIGAAPQVKQPTESAAPPATDSVAVDLVAEEPTPEEESDDSQTENIAESTSASQSANEVLPEQETKEEPQTEKAPVTVEATEPEEAAADSCTEGKDDIAVEPEDEAAKAPPKIAWGSSSKTMADLFKDGGASGGAAAPVSKLVKPQQASRPAPTRDTESNPTEHKATSLYVKGTPEGCDAQQLKKLFLPFGASIYINLKNGYAFVDYDSHESVLKALEFHRKTPFKYGDKTLEVEERSNSKSSRGGFNGANAGGRGGYRSRGGHGRGNNPRKDRKDKVDNRQRGDRRDGDNNRRDRSVRRGNSDGQGN
jgi:hypothetical protein